MRSTRPDPPRPTTEGPAFPDRAAGGHDGWWRYPVVVVGVAVVLAGSGTALAVAAGSLDSVLPEGVAAAASTLVAWPLTQLALLALFRRLHARPIRGLFTASGRIRPGRAVASYAVGVVVMTAGYAAALQMVRPSADPRQWIALRTETFADTVLLLGLAAIVVQVVTEELVFRGYLMGGLARTRSRPVVPIAVSAVLFAAAHAPVALLGGGGPGPALRYLGWTLAMGLAFGVWTWLDGSLWVAIGVHAAVNTFSYLVVSPVERDLTVPTPAQVELASTATSAFQLAGLVLLTLLLFGRRAAGLRLLASGPRPARSSSPAGLPPGGSDGRR